MKVAILGTNTDVGKTYVARLIAKKLNALVLKPVETGEGDTGKLMEEGVRAVNVYKFSFPATPLLSARMEGKKIERDYLVRRCMEIMNSEKHVLLEGVGGVASPIWRNFYSADIAADLGLDVVLIAKNELGAITSTITAVRFVESRGANVRCVVLNMSSGGVVEEKNAEIISDELGIRVFSLGYGDEEVGEIVDYLKGWG